MTYAVGWYIKDESVVRWAKDGRRFKTRDQCFDAALAENAKGLLSLVHTIVDIDHGIAVERSWMRVEAV